MAVSAVEGLLFARLKTGKGYRIGGVLLFDKGGEEGFTLQCLNHCGQTHG
jgi:hypothetical protein